MKKYIVAFASITYANKAKAFFNKSGISAEIKRTPKNIAGGCGYSVTTGLADVDDVLKILEKNNIPHKSISEI